MRRPNVLITGFEPFGNSNYNISEDITKKIQNLEIGHINLVTKILTVDEDGSKFVSELIKKENFDCIIHLGFSDKAKEINIESRAKNLLSMEIEDNSGRKIIGSKIIENSADEIFSTAEINKLLNIKFTDYKISNDAGNFICNETYYYTLESIFSNKILDRFGRVLPCIFIHLPSRNIIQISEQIKLILELINNLTSMKIINVVAGVIRNKENKILVAKRDQYQPHPGKWEFPGGKLKFNESIEDGLKREILEELNLTINIISECGEITHLYEEYFMNLKLMNVKINQYSENIKLNVHEDAKWVKENELNNFDWLEANLKLVEIIQNQS